MDRKQIPLLLVSIALIGVCGLCALTVYGTYAWIRTSRADVRFFDIANVSASITENETFEAKPNLIVDSDSGSITILAGDGPEIEVEMVKTGWGTDQAEAEQVANAIQVTVEESADTLKFIYNVPEEIGIMTSRGGIDHVDFTIRVPAETAVETISEFGDISLTGLSQSITVENGFGEITAQDIEAGENSIRLVTSFGDLTVENSQGDEFYIETSNGMISATGLNATGDIEVNNSFGEISLTEVTASSIVVITQNGKVEVTDGNADDNLEVTNAFGDILVESFETANYTLHTNNGEVVLTSPASGSDLILTTSFGGITITDGADMTLDLETNNGDIEVSGTLNAETDHAVNTSFGDILLTIPEGSAFELELETSFGDITSDLPVTLIGTLNETSWQGELNGGGNLLTAITNNGNISIQVLAPGGE